MCKFTEMGNYLEACHCFPTKKGSRSKVKYLFPHKSVKLPCKVIDTDKKWVYISISQNTGISSILSETATAGAGFRL